MKKIFLLGLVFTFMFGFCSIAQASVEDTEEKISNNAIIKEAITKYKDKNYIGCISDLRLYTEKDPSNAVAWYYLGSSYMNVAMKQEAHAAYEKVISLNSVPKLTSYSIQAEICMENPQRCKYQDFTNDEIKKLRANPNEFLEQYFAKQNNTTKDADTVEIEKLIKGNYYNNIHPTAKKFIDDEKTRMKQNEINENKAYLPSDYKLSQALNMLKDSNNEMSSFAMMLDSPKKTQDADFAEIIRGYHEADNNKTLTPEMLQLMMMQNMLPNF